MGLTAKVPLLDTLLDTVRLCYASRYALRYASSCAAAAAAAAAAGATAAGLSHLEDEAVVVIDVAGLNHQHHAARLHLPRRGPF